MLNWKERDRPRVNLGFTGRPGLHPEIFINFLNIYICDRRCQGNDGRNQQVRVEIPGRKWLDSEKDVSILTMGEHNGK